VVAFISICLIGFLLFFPMALFLGLYSANQIMDSLVLFWMDIYSNVGNLKKDYEDKLSKYD